MTTNSNEIPGGTVFRLGEVMPEFRGPRPEAPHFNFDVGGPYLHYFYRDPTPREIRGARTGKVRFALVPAGEHTLFLLCRAEGLTKGWSDAPYALGVVKPDRRGILERQPHQGRLLLMTLADAQSGLLHALRQISLTPAFSAKLDELVEKQRAALPRFSAEAHQAEIRAAYRRWPDPDSMVGAAVAVEHGGMDFHGTQG